MRLLQEKFKGGEQMDNAFQGSICIVLGIMMLMNAWGAWALNDTSTQIQPIDDYEATGGGQFTAKVTVMNVGTTPDTFVVSAMGLGVGQMNVVPPEQSIGVGQSADFYITFGVGDVDTETERDVTVVATAMGSQEKDERTFKVTIMPSSDGDNARDLVPAIVGVVVMAVVIAAIWLWRRRRTTAS